MLTKEKEFKFLTDDLTFKKVFDDDYKPIAVSFEEWEPIKVEFNKNIKSKNNVYEYKEESNSLDEIYEIKKEKKEKNKTTNEIEDIFDDVIVYN